MKEKQLSHVENQKTNESRKKLSESVIRSYFKAASPSERSVSLLDAAFGRQKEDGNAC